MELQNVGTFDGFKNEIFNQADTVYRNDLIDTREHHQIKNIVEVACKQLENLPSQEKIDGLKELKIRISKAVYSQDANLAISKIINKEVNKIKFKSSIDNLNITFKPLYFFTLSSNEKYENFKKEWENLNLKDARAHFDDENRVVYIGHSVMEFLALGKAYKNLHEYFFDASDEYAFYSKPEPILKFQKISGTDLSTETQELIREGQIFFNDHVFSRGDYDMSSLKDNYTDVKAIEEMLRFSKGFIIGENHSEICSKKFLIYNMEALKKEGVTTFFLEHVFKETTQTDLDNCFNHPNEPMPTVLEAYLDSQDTGNQIGDLNFGYKALVKAAINAGIRVVAIDTEASYNAGLSIIGSSGPDRAAAMNYQAQKIINSEGNEGKFVALIGNTHVSHYDNVPGLSEILNCPNILFLASKTPNIHLNVRNWDWSEFSEEKKMQGYYDMIVERPENMPSNAIQSIHLNKEDEIQKILFSEWEKITHLPSGRLQIIAEEEGKYSVKVDLSSLGDKLDEQKLLSIGDFIEHLNSEKISVEIKELNLSGNPISGRFLVAGETEESVIKKLSPFSKVEILNMSRTNTSPTILNFLNYFPSLKEINFDHCKNFNAFQEPDSLPKGLNLISVKGTPVKTIPDLSAKFPDLKIDL